MAGVARTGPARGAQASIPPGAKHRDTRSKMLKTKWRMFAAGGVHATPASDVRFWGVLTPISVSVCAGHEGCLRARQVAKNKASGRWRDVEGLKVGTRRGVAYPLPRQLCA